MKKSVILLLIFSPFFSDGKTMKVVFKNYYKYTLPKIVSVKIENVITGKITLLQTKAILNNKCIFQFETTEKKLILIDETSDMKTIIVFLYVDGEEDMEFEISDGDFFPIIWVKKAKYPGNNCLYSKLYPEIVRLNEFIKKNTIVFTSFEEVQKFVDTLFYSRIQVKFETLSKLFPVSDKFASQILQSQFIILKFFFVKSIALKSKGIKIPEFLLANALKSSNPEWWSGSYLQRGYFETYIREIFSAYQPATFEEYFKKVIEIMKPNDTIYTSKLLLTAINVFAQNNEAGLDSVSYQYIKEVSKSFKVKGEVLEDFISSKKNTKSIDQPYLDSIYLYSVDIKKQTFASLLTDTAKIYLLDFWASWCQPCISGFPEMFHLDSIYKSVVNIRYINMDGKESAFIPASIKYGLPKKQSYKMLMDNENINKLSIIKSDPSLPDYTVFVYKNKKWKMFKISSPNHIKGIVLSKTASPN